MALATSFRMAFNKLPLTFLTLVLRCIHFTSFLIILCLSLNKQS